MSFIEHDRLTSLQDDISRFHDRIHNHNRRITGTDALGWVDLAVSGDEKLLQRIQKSARKAARDSDILLVIGIGGSYLGAQAVMESLNPSFHNQVGLGRQEAAQVIFAGHNMSSKYTRDVIDLLSDKDFSINVISKSGSTLETAIAFRLFRDLLEERYGVEEARSRIFVTTENGNGPLSAIAEKEGYETFFIPEDIGGRYSVLTAVGLFPMAVSGIQIEELQKGAKAAADELNEPDIEKNMAYHYAAIRNVLYENGKTIELFVSYEPALRSFGEWWKQLFAESEGKMHKGIFPATATFTTDLHSIGQYIQEGHRNIFETVINIETDEREVIIRKSRCSLDGIDYLNGRSLHQIQEKAFEGTVCAHFEGGVPNILLHLPKLDAYHVGYMLYFFLLSCTMSGYLLGVNPFDQPGVEAYKKNMMAALKNMSAVKE